MGKKRTCPTSVKDLLKKDPIVLALAFASTLGRVNKVKREDRLSLLRNLADYTNMNQKQLSVFIDLVNDIASEKVRETKMMVQDQREEEEAARGNQKVVFVPWWKNSRKG